MLSCNNISSNKNLHILKNILKIVTICQQLVKNMLEYQERYNSYSAIIGIDEVGRGPLSGPVVACAFLLDDIQKLPSGVNDSKKVSAKKRTELAKNLAQNFNYGLGIVSNAKIDEVNILQATYIAMREALQNLENSLTNRVKFSNCPILIDGRDNPLNRKKYPLSQAIIKGDGKSLAIAAASIVAKVYRDNLMEKLGEKFPQYNWKQNAGYGTKQHRMAIEEYGITEHHRKTFVKIV